MKKCKQNRWKKYKFTWICPCLGSIVKASEPWPSMEYTISPYLPVSLSVALTVWTILSGKTFSFIDTEYWSWSNIG